MRPLSASSALKRQNEWARAVTSVAVLAALYRALCGAFAAGRLAQSSTLATLPRVKFVQTQAKIYDVIGSEPVCPPLVIDSKFGI